MFCRGCSSECNVKDVLMNQNSILPFCTLEFLKSWFLFPFTMSDVCNLQMGLKFYSRLILDQWEVCMVLILIQKSMKRYPPTRYTKVRSNCNCKKHGTFFESHEAYVTGRTHLEIDKNL